MNEAVMPVQYSFYAAVIVSKFCQLLDSDPVEKIWENP